MGMDASKIPRDNICNKRVHTSFMYISNIDMQRAQTFELTYQEQFGAISKKFKRTKLTFVMMQKHDVVGGVFCVRVYDVSP
jgi:hypothetical protein